MNAALPRMGSTGPSLLATLLVVGGATLALCLPMLTFPMGQDQAFYAYAGWILRSGGTAGVDFWAQTPPATAYLCALFQLLAGHDATAIRWLDLIWSLGTGLALAGLGRSLYGPWIGLLTGLIWAWSYGARYDYWNSAQVDGLLTLPWIAALALVWKASHSSRARLWWLAGAALAQAFMIKYVALALWLPLCWVAWHSGRPMRRVLAGAGGFLIGLAPWILWLGATGSLAPLVEAQREMSFGYTTLGFSHGIRRALVYALPGLDWFLVTHAGLLVLAVGGVFALRGSDSVARALTLGWAAAALVSFAAQLKGFPYHSLPLLAPLSLLSAGALLRLARGAPRIAAFAAAALLLGSQFPAAKRWAEIAADGVEVLTTASTPMDLWRRQDRPGYSMLRAELELAARIRAESEPDATIYVWGYEPLVHFASGRRAPTRFIANAPLFVPWAEPAWREELVGDLRTHRPSHLVVCHHDQIPWVTGLARDSASLLKDFEPLRRLIREAYRPAWVLRGVNPHRPQRRNDLLFTVYRRVDRGLSGSS